MDPDDPMNQTCDAGRYKDFKTNPKYTNNLYGSEIRPCARAGSASAMRVAIGAGDTDTMAKEIPNGVDHMQVIDIYNMSNDQRNEDNFARVTVEQSLMVWRLFANALIEQTKIKASDVHIKQIKGSPVGYTYDLVNETSNDTRSLIP